LSVAVFGIVDLCLLENILVGRSVELIQTLLPASVALDANLDATENDFFSTFEIDTELDDITIVEWKCTALHARTAQAHMVQERAGTTFDVFDEPLAVVAPELAMPAANNFALEANRSCRLCTCL